MARRYSDESNSDHELRSNDKYNYGRYTSGREGGVSGSRRSRRYDSDDSSDSGRRGSKDQRREEPENETEDGEINDRKDMRSTHEEKHHGIFDKEVRDTDERSEQLELRQDKGSSGEDDEHHRRERKKWESGRHSRPRETEREKRERGRRDRERLSPHSDGDYKQSEKRRERTHRFDEDDVPSQKQRRERTRRPDEDGEQADKRRRERPRRCDEDDEWANKRGRERVRKSDEDNEKADKRRRERTRCYGEDDDHVEKRGRDGSYRHESGRRRHDTEDKSRNKDRHLHCEIEEGYAREMHRSSERHSSRGGNDKDMRHRAGSEMKNRTDKVQNDMREDTQLREDGDARIVEDSKALGKLKLREGNLNSESLGRTGGVYIPPFKLARMMKEVQDKSSVEYQRLTWDALRKSINGLVNKVNAANIKNIIPELFAENLIRGRGLFCRSCMKSQMASPGFTDVFAALVAVVNTKFPEVGDLLLRRIVLQLKRSYKRNDKPQLLAAVKFIAHLVNQQVAHEIIALELLTILLENPTDDSVEVAVGFVTECGSILQDLSPKGLHGIFERFRGILHEGEIDKRVQFLIEGLFAIRKAKFQGYPAVRPELDLVEPEDQLTHEISLQDEIEPEIELDIFKPDPDFLENERRYEELKRSILGEESEDEEGSDAASDEEDDDEEDESEEEDEQQMQIKDQTETNLVNLRRTIYLTIMSSVDFEEAGHKLLKIKLEPGQEMELCIMLIECCSQERTYLRYYGLLGQRFCMINKVYQENFEKCFVQQYSMIHRLETNKLRNVAKFFAHLLGTDAMPWHILAYIRLTEEDTTSSSRIFIKILFQELSEHLGILRLNERLQDPTMQDSFESIFPKDNPKNTRFSINFFTSIGLGGITENLREYLKNMPRLIMQQQKPLSELGSGSDSDSRSESDGSESSSSDDSSECSSESESDSSSSEERGSRRRKRRRRD